MSDDLTPRERAENALKAAGFEPQLSRPLLDRRWYWYRDDAARADTLQVYAVTVLPTENFGTDTFGMTLSDDAQHLGAYLNAKELLEACEAQEAAEAHHDECPTCQDDCTCMTWVQLAGDAQRMRVAAIAKVEGQEAPNAHQG